MLPASILVAGRWTDVDQGIQLLVIQRMQRRGSTLAGTMRIGSLDLAFGLGKKRRLQK